MSASSPVVPGEFWRDVRRKACWEISPRTPGNKRQIQNGRARFSQRKRQPHFVSTIYNAPQMFGRNVFNLYIRNIPWSSQKKAGFRRSVSGTFSRWIGTFCHFVPGLLFIALGPKPSSVTRIAGIGMGTRQGKCYGQNVRQYSECGNCTKVFCCYVCLTCKLSCTKRIETLRCWPNWFWKILQLNWLAVSTVNIYCSIVFALHFFQFGSLLTVVQVVRFSGPQ